MNNEAFDSDRTKKRVVTPGLGKNGMSKLLIIL